MSTRITGTRTLTAAMLIAVSVGACGSITRGTTEKMAFLTEPSGATMTSTKGYACPATPCSLEVDRSDAFDVTFAKPGFQPALIPVRTQVVGAGAAGMAGNVLAGGVIGIGVDAYTGAALDHTPNPVSAVLVPEARPGAPHARRRRAPDA
ncbi:translation initiation factor 2 [Methylobacterium sp. V23]|uniref:translation initiation factor 2 n=1 Tax=Methylobacterium sp. V23 TaxID=2044878 RepID=UPI001FDF5B2E|nr:translation initiation factor 2 [Methylobacterium sp. V23]